MPMITSKLGVAKPTMEPQLPPSRKVQVVYYLSRAGQLEHPHLLEVSVSPTEGLYLRDVKKRLAVIRGRSLPSTFAWSYKRSYKNGYVWQDLCDDDLIFPAHGCDYVLKGSEIVSEAYADKCRHTSAFGSQDGKPQQELTKNRCQELSTVPTKATLPSKQYSVLEQSTDGADKNYGARGTSISNSRSHITFDFANAQEENPQFSHAKSARMQHNSPSPGRFYAATSETSGEEEVRSAWQNIPTKGSLHVSMVENGTDAATQTEEKAKALCAAAKNNERLQQINAATELKKGDISSPPSSSSANSLSPYASASTADQNLASSDENIRLPQSPWKRAQHQQEQDDTDPGTPSTQTATRKAVVSQDCRSEEPSPRPRAKHLGAASSLLQFVSCGGLDIKEQILPMSLYLKSRGSQHPSTEHFCEVLYAGQGKSWSSRLGRKNCLKPKCSYDIETSASISSPGSEKSFSEAPANIRRENKDKFSASRSLCCEAVLPDVISIGRPSISDRSTNVSRELDYQTDANSKVKIGSGTAEIKGSLKFSSELDYQTDSSKSRGSGEIKCSPVFVPGKCAIRRSGPLYSNRGGLATPSKDAQKSVSISGPLSGRDEMRETVSAAKRSLAMGEKGGYETMAQLWEELRSPVRELKDGDQRLQALDSNSLDWERTLQNAVDMSLPPVDFLVLHECLHCGRKFKPDLLKAHIKSCSAQKSSKNGALGRPPKPDTNIYQRLLRASPPPTKQLTS